MSIKSNLMDWLNKVSDFTTEVNLRKDILPVVEKKEILDIPDHALKVAKFVSLTVSTLDSIVENDPELKTLEPLHTTIKDVYETPPELRPINR